MKVWPPVIESSDGSGFSLGQVQDLENYYHEILTEKRSYAFSFIRSHPVFSLIVNHFFCKVSGIRANIEFSLCLPVIWYPANTKAGCPAIWYPLHPYLYIPERASRLTGISNKHNAELEIVLSSWTLVCHCRSKALNIFKPKIEQIWYMILFSMLISLIFTLSRYKYHQPKRIFLKRII